MRNPVRQLLQLEPVSQSACVSEFVWDTHTRLSSVWPECLNLEPYVRRKSERNSIHSELSSLWLHRVHTELFYAVHCMRHDRQEIRRLANDVSWHQKPVEHNDCLSFFSPRKWGVWVQFITECVYVSTVCVTLSVCVYTTRSSGRREKED